MNKATSIFCCTINCIYKFGFNHLGWAISFSEEYVGRWYLFSKCWVCSKCAPMDDTYIHLQILNQVDEYSKRTLQNWTCSEKDCGQSFMGIVRVLWYSSSHVKRLCCWRTSITFSGWGIGWEKGWIRWGLWWWFMCLHLHSMLGQEAGNTGVELTHQTMSITNLLKRIRLLFTLALSHHNYTK